MKTIAVPGVVLIAFALGTQAQPTGGFGNEGRTEDGYSIKERGPHHRTWERLEVETTPMGTQVERKLSYTELETGMHYWQDNQWKEATEEIDILGDHALVTKTAHKVVFKANFADAGVVDLLTPDEKRLRSHILGLSYFDSASGESVLIAEPRESFGQVLPPNQVFFLDAFDDVVADVRYTVSKAGCEQDVIIRAQLPDPSALGLDPETTRLQVFTEFIEFPSPARRIIQAMRPGGLPDESLSFGAMRIEHSKAFAIGEGESAKKVRVFKQWATLEGRTFLIEELPLRNISAALQSLPQGRTASVTPRRKGQGENALLALKQFLPKRLASSATTKPIRLAESSLNRQPGFVLDYAILSGAADFTFQAGATYYCTNTVNLSGTTRIEGGTVVKFASNSTAQINISGDLVWATAAYRPAIFTAKDDNSTGETITGSTGNPTGFYGGGLHVYGYYSALNVLSNLCLLHLQNALNLGFDEAQQFTVANAQFVKCNTALSLMGSLNVNNALFYKIATNFNSSAGESLWVGHHLTVDQCEVFNNAYKATINLTNSLLAGVTNLDTSGYYWLYTNKVALLASDAGIFQTIGGGAHYLAANSPYRNAGTTNLDTTLLADLAAKTTYPPLAYTNTALPGYDTFYPMAQRDTDVPDLGYHYDPLDYLVGKVDVNADTTFAPGVAVGWFRYNQGWTHAGHGIHVADTKTLTFDGQAESPCYFVHQTAVQENRIGYTTIDAGPGGITGWATTKTNRPYLNLQFTRCAGLPIYRNHFRDDSGGLYVSANHSEFYGGGLGGYVSDAGFTNCLLDRTFVWLEAGNTNYADVFAFRNCTVRGGTFSINRQSSTDGHIQTTVLDSAFDSTSVSTSDSHAANASLTRYDYNAYLTNASRTYPTGVNDVVVSSFNWQRGWLGDLYLPAGSSLINTGSVTDAASVGLYHFTTTTNQVKETNSVVDIGYHYVALDTNNVPTDTDTGGVADYLEDLNGSGTVNGIETDWTSGHGHDDKDHPVNKHLLTPGYLRCEYRVDPWGVDAKDPWTGQQKPRLYWITTSQRRAAKQVAYRILVASSPEKLNEKDVDMWDSGRVCSDQTIHVEYDPTQHQLQSGQRLWWKVKTWELFSGKASPWSTNGFFQMGLLNTNDWSGAKWIGVPGYNSQSQYQPCPVYRSQPLMLTNQLKRATAYVSAKGVYEFWINGQKVGKNILAPEWTDYRTQIQYQTYDVTSCLTNGTSTATNILGAIVGEGWFSAPVNSSLEVGRGAYGLGSPQFALRLDIESLNMTNFTVTSSSDWRCFTNGPIRRASIYQGETYDATREASGTNWSHPSYQDAVVVFTNSVTATNVVQFQMVAQPSDPIQITQLVQPVTKWSTNNDFGTPVVIFDLGQNIAGVCALRVELGNSTNIGSTITLRHAETLDLGPNNSGPPQGSSGRIYTNGLFDLDNKNTAQLDRYILNGDSIQVFRPRFTYHGFRYVEVSGPNSILNSLTLNSVTGCVSHSSVPFTGNFYSSHSSPGNVNLNKLMTNAFWGLRGNLQGVFTACTARGERQGYMYDEHIFSQTACFSADMAAFFTKTIRDIRTNQAANGRYPVYAPFDNWPGVIDPPHGEDPGLQAGGLIFPWRMYQNYADGRMLVEHYRSASNWLAYCTNQFPTFYWKATNADGHSQFNVADWMHSYYDDHVPNWTPPSRPNRSGLEGTNWGTGWYAYSADTVAAMAQALETDAGSRGLWQAANMYAAEKSRYLDLAVQVRAAYLNLPLPWIRYDQNNKISGVFYNTQADCLAALIFNMVPDEQRENVWNILLNGSNGINNFNSFAQVTPRLSTGYYFSSQGMLELTRNGATPKAYDLLMDTGFRSWLYPVVNNFTTCWEGYSTWAATYGYHPSGHFRSFNHLPFGAVSEWVWRVVGGINLDQGQPGYQNVIIKPEPGGGLTNAFASFNSIHGPIVCTWTTNSLQTNYVLNVTVPANATGSIFIPSTNLARITESGGSAVNAIGVFSYYFTNAPNFPNATVFQVGSGSYNFNLSSN